MMFAALSWGHTPLAKTKREETSSADYYRNSNWDKILGVQEWIINVHHTHLMMTQRTVCAKKSDTDSHCPLVVTIRSAYKSGQRTRGIEGKKKRQERQIERKGGKGKDKSSGKDKSTARGKVYKGKNKE